MGTLSPYGTKIEVQQKGNSRTDRESALVLVFPFQVDIMNVGEASGRQRR